MLNTVKNPMLKFLTKKRLFILTTVFVCVAIFAVVFLLPQLSLAQEDDSFGLAYAQNVGLSTEDLRTSAVRITRNILGVLGILALIILLYGGFVYMTSRGDMQKVELAKKILLNATIGLIIIMMAFAIVSWILGVLSSGESGSSGNVCESNICSGCARCNSDGTGYYSDDSCDASCNGNLPSSYFSISDVQTSHGEPISGSHDDDEDKSNVFWCSKIQTIFNHDVDAQSVVDSVADNDLRIAINNTVNSANGDYTTRGNVLSFTPTDYKFENLSTEHSSRLTSGRPDDTLGLHLSQCSITASCDETPPNTHWDFYVGTEGDEINPYITSTYPTSDQSNAYYPDINVSRDPTIQVTFSEAVDWEDISDISGLHPNASNIFVRNIDTNQVLVNTMWNIEAHGNGFIMYLNNSNLLDEFTNYEITVQNIHDLCGNLMDNNPYIWQFATNDVVPGINSHYPDGNNVCPDTVISLTYNTSMYPNQITFSIQAENGDPSIYVLEPSENLISTTNNIGSGDIEGTFRVVDVDTTNINNNYRVYEFTPLNNLTENTTYLISYTSDKVIDINGNTLNYNWNFTVADMASCVCSPYISYLSKEQGPVGDCLTINGQCFTGTQAQPAEISDIYFNLNNHNTNAIIGDGYSANTVGTTVPDNFSPNDYPQVSLSINYLSGNSVPPSNTKTFAVTTGEATGPCLWSINPNYGQPGVANVSLNGLRFGAYADSNLHQIIFTANQNFNVTDSNNWSDTKIQNVIVPINTIDGDVVVTNDVGTSNAMPFDARYCGDEVVDPGEDCDGTNLNGKDCEDVGWLGGTLSCSSNCKFNTSNCSNAPQVIENSTCLMNCSHDSNQSCQIDADCGSGNQCQISQSPSPNPYKNSQDVCLNISIQADFNTTILGSTLNTTNIYLENCGNDSTCSNSLTNVPATITYPSSGQDVTSFILTPTNYLSPDTWYQGTITTGVRSTANVAMQENYIWRFKTKADVGLCPLEKIHVTPDNIDNAGSNTTYPYNASATGPNCIVLQGDYDWQWSVDEPILGVTVTEELSDDSNSTVLTDEEKGTTNVRAESEGKYDTGRLNINFDTCTLDSDCTDPDGDGNIDCPGSVCDIATDRCTPVINSLDPASGPIARWVTLNGCHFKHSRGSGNVYFGSDAVTIYPCNEVWQDNQIIVSVPTSLSVGNVNVSVTDSYNLDSNNSPFNVTTECATNVPVPVGGVPGICSLHPDSGMPQTSVSITGENFSTGGQQGDYVTFNNNQAEISDWNIQSINTIAPPTDNSGDVPVVVNVADCPSNSYLFEYTNGAQGDPCDRNLDNFDNNNQPICDASDSMCYSGLYCDNSDCTCQPVPMANVIASSRYPYPSTVCRNTTVTATFDTLMNHSTIDTQLWRKVLGSKPNENCIYGGLNGSEGSGGGHNLGYINNNKLVLFINSIKNWFFNFFRPTVQAQLQTVYWCPTDGYVITQDIAQGVDECDSADGCTKFIFSSSEPLVSNGEYYLHIKGGANGAKTIKGAELTTNSNNTIYYHEPSYRWSFTVGNQICQIDNIKVDVSFNVDGQSITRDNTTYDFYTCAGRNDCTDDVNLSINGNQHSYLAQAYDAFDVPLVASYLWSEYDTKNLIEINPIDGQQPLVTANPYDGNSIIRVSAEDPNPDDNIKYGQAMTSVNVTNFICENPWPSLTTFPWQDSENNCSPGLSGNSCHDMTFSTYYCRDFGHDEPFCLGGDNNNNNCTSNNDCPNGRCADATEDDLPVPTSLVIKGEQQGFCVGGSNHGDACFADSDCSGISYCSNVLKEYMYNFNQNLCLQSNTECNNDEDCPNGDTCQDINDSIGIRIYNNAEHLSPSAWYQKYANQPGSFTTKEYDGYNAINSGRTTYINMAVDSGTLKSSPIYTDMFLMSYTDDYAASTLNIHDQLLDYLTFNINGVDDVRLCDSNSYCEKDSDCPKINNGGGSEEFETCNANKTKLVRDTIRLGHLSEMIYHLDIYRGYCSNHQNLPCVSDTECPNYASPGYPDEPTSEFCIQQNNTYPLLEAGTYISGQSTSVWDSWNNNLASLLGSSALLDPLNEVYCDQNNGYNEECWNQDTQNFSCDSRAHFYHYISTGSGADYNLNLNMEYSNNGWQPGVAIGNLIQNNVSGSCYNLQYQHGMTPVCGNGIVEGSEECDENNLNGQTCVSQGYEQGNLTCHNCHFDISDCSYVPAG